MRTGRPPLDAAGPRPRVVASIALPDAPGWADAVEVIGEDLHAVDGDGLRRLRLIPALLRAGRAADAVVVNGSVGLRGGYADLLAAALVSRRGGPAVLVAEAQWGLGSSWPGRVGRRLGAAVLRRRGVVFCVLSSAERDAFPQLWGVPAKQVALTPYYLTLPPGELELPTRGDGGVFAGGDCLRDYDALYDIAVGLPVPVTFAVRTRLRPPPGGHPPHVHVGPVPRGEFFARMRAAGVVVVPLVTELRRSTAQQTYLNAMALGKVVVVTDAPGVRDHVEDGVSGWVVPGGDRDALAAAIHRALDPAQATAAQAMGHAAQARALGEFTAGHYAGRLLDLVAAHVPADRTGSDQVAAG